MYLADLPPEVRVRTLVSRSRPRLREFLKALDGPAVLKALSPSGASKIFYVRRKQKANVNQILSALTKEGYVVAQEYLPEADHGEKRVVLLGGEPIRFGDVDSGETRGMVQDRYRSVSVSRHGKGRNRSQSGGQQEPTYSARLFRSHRLTAESRGGRRLSE